MNKTLIVGLGLLALSAILVSDAAAHGGLYRGPGPSFPPPFAPGTGRAGGPTTPGNAGPATQGPTTLGGSRSVRTGARKSAGTDYTGWATWWEMNKHPYLNLRARLSSRFSVTGLGRDGLDGNRFEGIETSVRPDFEELKGRILPVLRQLLREDDPDIVDSAVLALARVTPADQADLVIEDLKGVLRHRDRSVQQSAILGLGVLGDRQAVPLLLEILRNSDDGRRLLRVNQDVHDVDRSLAAVALGYLSDPRAIPVLQQIALETPDSNIELKAGAIMALGLFQEGQYEIVPFLIERLSDSRLSELMLAQVPVALSRMGDAARPVLPRLLQMAESRKTKNIVRESCIIALGKLAAADDEEIVKALTRLAEKSNDQASSNFAFIALGEIGFRAALDKDRHGAMLNGLTRFLLRNLTRSRKQSQTAWAATACALLGRGYGPKSEERLLISSKLARSWKETKSPAERGTLTICLGLVEARAMGDELLEALKESGDRNLNGYLAEALGLMRHEAAAPDLLRILRNDNDATYRVQVATGLGLMGDLEVSGMLVKELSRARTLWVTSAVAKALGNVGDRTAIDPLLDLVQARSRPGLARAFGAVALGLVGEKTPFPWNSRVKVGVNYMAAFYTQTEIMDIL